MSAHELENQGRQAYKHGEFAKAVDYFTRALVRQQTVQLYDLRAASHEKLNDFKKALQDAKAAIRTADVDPTGYLRAGRILVKMEKPKAALDIYAYGLKHIKHVGQGYKHLKKLHDDILAELAPSHSVDPLTVLPRELAVSVLQYCSFRERIAVCRVSKGWQKFIRSEPNLWTHLDLGAARSKVKTSFVSVAINTARAKLTSATLSRLYDFDKVLAALLRHCPLESLTLAQTGLQGSNLVDALKSAGSKLTLRELRILPGTEVSQATLREAVAVCKDSLQVLHCAHVKSLSFASRWNELVLPELKSLSITANSFSDLALGFPDFLKHAPQLETLKLVDTGACDRAPLGTVDMLDLRETRLQNIHLELPIRWPDLSTFPTTIRSLRLLGRATGRPDWPATGTSLGKFPNLADVQLRLHCVPLHALLSSFSCSQNLTRSETEAKGASNMRLLTLDQPAISPLAPLVVPDSLKGLETLRLRDAIDLMDDKILELVKELPKLRSLDVSGSKITGAGIADLLRLNQLTELAVNNCHSIGHRDAIDHARKRGVKVEYKMAETSTGRKVRY